MTASSSNSGIISVLPQIHDQAPPKWDQADWCDVCRVEPTAITSLALQPLLDRNGQIRLDLELTLP